MRTSRPPHQEDEDRAGARSRTRAGAGAPDGDGRPGPAARLGPPLAGAALGTALAGAALAWTDFSSPLRAPLTVFFLLAAPAAALAAGLRALDPLGRVVVALIGSAAVNALVAQVLLATGAWSVRTAVAVIATGSAVALAWWACTGAGRGSRRRR